MQFFSQCALCEINEHLHTYLSHTKDKKAQNLSPIEYLETM